jgi:putative ABC transport system substrate-binding protein
MSVFAFALELSALCPGAGAQTTKVHRIGYLTVAYQAQRMESFRKGLRDLGYVEGQSITIDERPAAGIYEKLPDLAAELAKLQVNVILAGGTSATRVAQRTTGTIPIVMATSTDDPVAAGFASSLGRPGANITGLSSVSTELTGKRLAILREVFPSSSRLGVLLNPDNPQNVSRLKELELAARQMGISLQLIVLRSPNDLQDAFRSAVQKRTDGLILIADGLFTTHRKLIVDLAVKNRVPMLYDRESFVQAGGLMSYGVDQDALYRRAAFYVDKILKGSKPADLPIEQPTKFELVINLKAAKQIGLTIPPNVLARADRVIK